MTKQKIIQQGAEATIFKKNCMVIKKRSRKSYRIKEIDDKIRKLRTRSESKLLIKASKIISVPKLMLTEEITKSLTMDFIDGEKLSDHLNEFDLKRQKTVFRVVGESIAKLHDSNIIHGDLTTSNMILKKNEVYFIDFGLGFQSHKLEDKAVDLHLLKQALEAKHFQKWKTLFKEFSKSYSQKNPKVSRKVLERLKAVEKRGRYKGKY